MKALNKLFLVGKRRKFWLVTIDVSVFVLINTLYYFLADKAAYSPPVSDFAKYSINSAMLLAFIFAARIGVRLYNNIWRYANTRAYFSIVLADCAAGLVTLIVARVVTSLGAPIYIGIWHAITVTSLVALATLMSRFAYRLLYKHSNAAENKKLDATKTPVAIIGAGQMGAHLASELSSNPASKFTPKMFIDIDTTKIGQNISGLTVYDAQNAEATLNKFGITTVVITMSYDKEKIEAIFNRYNSLGCKIKIYARPLSDDGDVPEGNRRVIRDFAIEDLLFRAPISINDKSGLEYYRGKTILVTGGGGSIGSEICRQIVKCGVKKLVIFDIYENNAYDIQQELVRKYGASLDLAVEIGSVRDPIRLDCIFKNYRPDVVFHAAAHKHVPLMEHSGCEAIKNNVIGTFNTANAAEKYGVGKFILVSTDKAVNPTNIMGASKRLCEMVIQCRTDSATSFAAVRFGNVLGSNGSVIPLFKRQITAGGPVTITDKRIIRYFMTSPEASQLVIEAGAKAKCGELFVLDMGKPVRIYDLAVNMIKLMGYEPDRDIEIKEIGLRPGEKLYEELLMKSEDLEKTDNDMIFIERDTPYTRAEVDEKLEILKAAVAESADTIDSTAVKNAIKRVVPTFIDPEEVNKTAEESEEMKKVKIPATV